MEKPATLYAIEEPAAPVKGEVFRLTGIVSHGPADPRPVGPPWPPQVVWHDVPPRGQGSNLV